MPQHSAKSTVLLDAHTKNYELRMGHEYPDSQAQFKTHALTIHQQRWHLVDCPAVFIVYLACLFLQQSKSAYYLYVAVMLTMTRLWCVLPRRQVAKAEPPSLQTVQDAYGRCSVIDAPRVHHTSA